MPLAIYSFKISFCIVPLKFFDEIPFLSAEIIYRASKVAAVEFMVIDVDIFSTGISLKSRSISWMVEIGTPTFPTSPSLIE